MERIDVNGTGLAYVDAGRGPETVVLSHSFLVDHRQFAAQIDALADQYRVIAFDHRDHGASARAESPYTLDDLVDDAVGLVDSLDAAPCHFVGLSTGGFVGMRIALRHPDRLRSVVLMDTDARSERLVARVRNKGMLTALRLFGTEPLMGPTMKLMFGPTFLGDDRRREEAASWRERIASNDAAALIRFGKAISSREDVLDDLRAVDLPALVVVGEHDKALPPATARALADAIPGAELFVVPDAGHLCTIERPDEVNDVLVSFLDERGRTTP